MECEATSKLLDAYLDGELDLVSSLEVERHLQACASCGAVHAGRLALKNELAGAALYEPAPVTLQTRVRAELRRLQGDPQKRRTINWRAFAVVGGIAATIAFALVLAARSPAPSRDD